MPRRATPRQRLIIEAIGQSRERLTIRDLGEKVGVSNPLTIQRELADLVQMGLITSDRRLKRRRR